MDSIQVTSVQYYNDKFNNLEGIKAIIDSQVVFVPLDPANRHYAEIMRQVEAGELTVEDAD